MSNTFTVREDGKNGTVEVCADHLTRTVKKMIGRDDQQVIPMRSVSSVNHDRKALSTDVVTVFAGTQVFVWKIKDAERFVEAVNTALFSVS